MLILITFVATLLASSGLFLWTTAQQKQASADAERDLRERDVALAQADDELTGKLLSDVMSSDRDILDLIHDWQEKRKALCQVSAHRRLAHAWTRAEARAELERRSRETLASRQAQLRLRWAAAQGVLLVAALSSGLIGYWNTMAQRPASSSVGTSSK